MYTDAQFTWSTAALISSGASTRVFNGDGLKTCRNITITIEKGTAEDTAVVGIEFARTSTSPFVRMGSTAYALASSVAPNECVIAQFAGPIGAVRPYVISKTASTTKIIVSLLAV